MEKAQSRHTPFNRSRGEFLLLKQVQLEPTEFLAAQQVRRFIEELRKLLDGVDVAASRFRRIVTALELVQHSLTK